MADLVSKATGRRILAMLNAREYSEEVYPNQFKRDARFVLVKCTDASPVSGVEGHWGNQYFPGQVVFATSETMYPPLGTASGVLGLPVLITLVGDDTASITPVLNKTYAGVLTGEVNADASGSLIGRNRVVCPYIPGERVSAWKEPVKCATTADVNLSTGGIANGTAHDGITVATGDRILVRAQALPAQNGIYVVPATGAASRSADNDGAGEFTGAVVASRDGATQKNFVWICDTNSAAITIGTTAVNWVKLAPTTVAGSSVKEPVKCATTADVNLSTGGIADGTTHDTVTVATGDRILVKSQALAAQNGIYIAPASGAATRASDAATGSSLKGATVTVTNGFLNGGKVWLQDSFPPNVVGTDDNTWKDISGNVYGPLTVVDNRALRTDGTNGRTYQSSLVTIEDDGSVTAADYSTGNSFYGGLDAQWVDPVNPDAISFIGYGNVSTWDFEIRCRVPFAGYTSMAGARLMVTAERISLQQGASVHDGDSGSIGPGATCFGGLIDYHGSGSWLVDPGDGLPGGTYP